MQRVLKVDVEWIVYVILFKVIRKFMFAFMLSIVGAGSSRILGDRSGWNLFWILGCLGWNAIFGGFLLHRIQATLFLMNNLPDSFWCVLVQDCHEIIASCCQRSNFNLKFHSFCSTVMFIRWLEIFFSWELDYGARILVIFEEKVISNWFVPVD